MLHSCSNVFTICALASHGNLYRWIDLNVSIIIKKRTSEIPWRLGRWDLMDDCVSTVDKEHFISSIIEGNLAQILQASIKKDHYMFIKKLYIPGKHC